MSKSKIEKTIPSPMKLIEEPTKVVDDIATASKVKFDEMMKASTEAAEKMMAANKERLEKAVKGYDEMSVFGKQTVEAIVSASSLTAKGIESLNAEVMAFAKSQVEDSITAGKAFMTAKTLQEFIDLQSGYAKTAYDVYVAQATKISEMASKMAKDAFEPINVQVKAAVEKFAKPLAA